MSNILVSGLVNIETTCSVGKFPVNYQPIDYNFFGVSVNTAGVGFNLAGALCALGDKVSLASMTGNDLPAKLIAEQLLELGVNSSLQNTLEQTPTSVILYDKDGRRKIYCDLKDIQTSTYDFSKYDLSKFDLVAACNINYNRPLLKDAKSAGVKIATDVHVLHDIRDEYNAEFMEYADVLFMSNEAVVGREEDFIRQLADTYKNEIIVIGCGGNGAVMYIRNENRIVVQPAAKPEKIVNTVGAGDALFSSFISLYSNGRDPEGCLALAQRFAAHKIGFDGASTGFMSMQELCSQV